VRAGALVVALLGVVVAVALGVSLVLVGTASDLVGDEDDEILSASAAVLWFGLSAVAAGAGALVRREPRRAAVTLAVVAVGGLVACGAWWLAVAPFPALAAGLAWAGRDGAKASLPPGEFGELTRG
jgi:hypothetical protein